MQSSIQLTHPSDFFGSPMLSWTITSATSVKFSNIEPLLIVHTHFERVIFPYYNPIILWPNLREKNLKQGKLLVVYRDWYTCGAPYTVCLLIWVAKLETSHVLQSNKTKLIGVALIAYQSLGDINGFLTKRSILQDSNAELFSLKKSVKAQIHSLEAKSKFQNGKEAKRTPAQRSRSENPPMSR